MIAEIDETSDGEAETESVSASATSHVSLQQRIESRRDLRRQRRMDRLNGDFAPNIRRMTRLPLEIVGSIAERVDHPTTRAALYISSSSPLPTNTDKVLNFPLADLNEVLETELRLIASGRSVADQTVTIDLISPFHYCAERHPDRSCFVEGWFHFIDADNAILNVNTPAGPSSSSKLTVPRLQELSVFKNLRKLCVYQLKESDESTKLPSLPNLRELVLHTLRISQLGEPMDIAFPVLETLHIACLCADLQTPTLGLYLPP